MWLLQNGKLRVAPIIFLLDSTVLTLDHKLLQWDGSPWHPQQLVVPSILSVFKRLDEGGFV